MMAPAQLQLDTKVKRREGPLSADLGDDVVLFDQSRGRYFGVRDVGATVWRELAHETTIAELCDRLQGEFAVDKATCERDVLAFLASLRAEQLIEVAPAR